MSFGIGGILGIGAEAGISSLFGLGFNASYGGGVFINNNTGAVNTGQFASAGAATQILGTSNSIPNTGQPVSILGASAGGSYGFFVTNANNANDLKGPFDTYSLNVGLVSMQLGTSNGTVIFSLGIGKAFGGSTSGYPTNTFYTHDDPTMFK